nr:hypothetical protein [Tanacetum cinerariifolium]
MGDDCTMADLAKTTRTGASSAITRHALMVDNFEIKGQFLHMILNQSQFSGALGIYRPTRNTIDNSAGGTIMHKTPNEAYKLIEDITVNTHEWYEVSRRATVKAVEANAVSEIAALINQMDMFNKKFDKLNATVFEMLVGCESYVGPRLTKDCDDKPMSSSEDACWVNQSQGNFQAGGSNGNNLSYK